MRREIRVSTELDRYTIATISDSLAAKLTRIMVRRDRSRIAGAIRYAADTTLVQEDELSTQELIQLLPEWTEEVDKASLLKKLRQTYN